MGRIWEETFTLNAIDRRTLHREGFGERGLDLFVLQNEARAASAQ